jgi:hypothetical protein
VAVVGAEEGAVLVLRAEVPPDELDDAKVEGDAFASGWTGRGRGRGREFEGASAAGSAPWVGSITVVGLSASVRGATSAGSAVLDDAVALDSATTAAAAAPK